LGYGRAELLGRSWYRLLHPEDLGHVARQHLRLGQCRQGPLGVPARGELVTRLQRKDGLGWTWVYARLRPEGPALLAHNFVISEAEAWCLRQQLAAEAPPGPPEPFGPGLDFPGAAVGAGGDLGPGIELGVGPGLGDGAGHGLGLAVSAGCGLGADVGHGLGGNAAATADHGLGATIGHGLG
ncbi:NPAS4 protein, partial [Poecile atricapillus]|nr:NPAS4 protein [Poecile atricapillus]